MKGILLAGGSGSRLYPTTKAISKQLLPIFNKPLIFYPLTTLMTAGIREILVISTPQDTPLIQRLLGTGEDWGLHLQYQVQPSPAGIAQAFILGADFIAGEGCALALGDNIHHGPTLAGDLSAAAGQPGSTIFVTRVTNPQDYGTLELHPGGEPARIIEKPVNPPSDLAVTGIYFYDSDISAIAAEVKPSHRGELEITDVNNEYMARGRMKVTVMDRDSRWFDAGTAAKMLEASIFVQSLEAESPFCFGCPATTAKRNGWIDSGGLSGLSKKYNSSPYADYLAALAG